MITNRLKNVQKSPAKRLPPSQGIALLMDKDKKITGCDSPEACNHQTRHGNSFNSTPSPNPAKSKVSFWRKYSGLCSNDSVMEI
jgi:hypothetical protein